MATPPPSVTVSPVDAARAAYHHTRSQLFPIRLEKWLVLGLLAFLDQCGRAFRGGGGSSGGGEGHGPGGWPPDLGHVGAWLQRASEWLAAHATLVALGAVLGLLVFGVVAAVVLWVNARGVFMYADVVATGRAEVSRPWRQHAAAASSYFGWSLGITFAIVFTLLFAAGLVVVTVFAFVAGRLQGTGGWLILAAMLPVLVLLALALPLLALAGLALRDFVAPLQTRHGAALRRRGSPARVAGRRAARRVRPLPAPQAARRGRDRARRRHRRLPHLLPRLPAGRDADGLPAALPLRAGAVAHAAPADGLRRRRAPRRPESRTGGYPSSVSRTRRPSRSCVKGLGRKCTSSSARPRRARSSPA